MTVGEYIEREAKKRAVEIAQEMAPELAANMAKEMAAKMAPELATKMSEEMSIRMVTEMLKKIDLPEAQIVQIITDQYGITEEEYRDICHSA